MRYLLITILTLSATGMLHGQSLTLREADSLKKVLPHQSGELAIQTLLSLADYQIFKAGERKEDLDRAMAYLSAAEMVNRQAHSKTAEASIAFFRSRLTREERHQDLARQQLEQSMPLIRRAGPA